ncbi:nascent polypeptide-associated complex subunit muscle-specific form-like protein [Labeo rohita]|uniref:Nascent polypeptide-associated complex subunit muscle-specific form-like protein n=1 Tax=Labeo rohita TaxID=84645 RepID=A0A498LJ28_LABRO|nr:nascent polypeptide-associated complex subunit muscle-specific form-like protein [Labeo rohita]
MGPPPPARAPKGTSAPAKFPEGEPVLTASPRSPERALRPNRSPEKAAVPLRSLKRAPGPDARPQGAPRKRLCPWSIGALPPPHKKQHVEEVPNTSSGSQHILKRPCPWSTGDSDSVDGVQPPTRKKLCVRP